MIHITLPDGSVRTFEQEQITPLEVAKDISNGLAKKAIVAKVDDQLCSLHHAITQDAVVSIYTFDDPRRAGYVPSQHFPHFSAGGTNLVPRHQAGYRACSSKMVFIMILISEEKVHTVGSGTDCSSK